MTITDLVWMKMAPPKRVKEPEVRYGAHAQEELVVPEALNEPHQVLEEEAHPDGRHQGHEAVGGAPAAEGPVGHALHQDGGEARHRRPHHHGHQEEEVAVGDQGGEVAEDLHPGHGPDHEDLGVGEVDELQDAIDHGVPQGDHGVDEAQDEAVKEHLG